MNKDEIFELINRNPSCHLATVVDGQPRVRGMLVYSADASGIIFHTGTDKELHRQLQANGRVELCFFDGENRRQVRVEGSVELLEDLELKKEIVGKREFLKPWIEASGYELLAVYRVGKMAAASWTMETNFAPTVFNKLS